MSLLKKVSAAALAAAMALSLSSCGKAASWGVNVDGREIRSGMLILEQTNALVEAYSHMSEEDTDVLKITIDGKASKEWINDKAVENIKKYAAIESKFDELGLSFSDAELKRISNNVDQRWEYVSETYEKVGVGRQTYYDSTLNDYKSNKIFEYYYGKGGTLEVPEDTIKAYLLENNARIKFIEMPLKDGEGNLLKSAGKEEMKARAEGYVERLKNGESFEAVDYDFTKYYMDLITSAQGIDPIEVEQEEPGSGTVIAKTSVYPSAEVAETVFGSMNDGDCVLVEENEVYYIVCKLDLFADDEYFDTYKDDALYSMKSDEFNAEVEKWVQGQNVIVNQKAIKKYKLETLTKE